MAAPITLDMSTAQPIDQPVKLDMSTAQPISSEGMQVNADNSFVITPKEDESFAQTMQRAAGMGRTVTSQMIQSQAQKGLKLAPLVLGAAPIAGASGAAALAGAGEAAAATPQAVAAIKAMASAHPFAAKLVSRALEGAAASAGGTAAYKWIKELL